jgi:hypothetical protein
MCLHDFWAYFAQPGATLREYSLLRSSRQPQSCSVEIATILLVPLPNGLDPAGSPRLAQFIFVLPGELPGVVDVIGKMHHFNFLAFIQRLPKLVFAEQWLCVDCLFAFVADYLYRFHIISLRLRTRPLF